MHPENQKTRMLSFFRSFPPYDVYEQHYVLWLPGVSILLPVSFLPSLNHESSAFYFFLPRQLFPQCCLASPYDSNFSASFYPGVISFFWNSPSGERDFGPLLFTLRQSSHTFLSAGIRDNPCCLSIQKNWQKVGVEESPFPFPLLFTLSSIFCSRASLHHEKVSCVCSETFSSPA